MFLACPHTLESSSAWASGGGAVPACVFFASNCLFKDNILAFARNFILLSFFSAAVFSSCHGAMETINVNRRLPSTHTSV